MTSFEIFKKAIDTYGVDTRLDLAIEEMSELIQAICKHKRGQDNSDNIAEEMADVRIMLEQLSIIFDNHKAVYDWQYRKLDRLMKNMMAEQKDEGAGNGRK